MLYPEVPEVLAQLDAAGLLLGVISHSLTNQIRASLAPVLHHFKGAIWSADNAGRFEKDVERYQLGRSARIAAPENCLVLDDKMKPLLKRPPRGNANDPNLPREPDQRHASQSMRLQRSARAGRLLSPAGSAKSGALSEFYELFSARIAS